MPLARCSGPLPGWLVERLARWYPGCLFRVPTAAQLVALTIDDGPDPSTTPLILAELRRQGARATFFLIAERAESQEGLVRRLVAEGHEVGNHFTRDRPSIRLSPRAFERDLLQAHRALTTFRPCEVGAPRLGMVLASDARGHAAWVRLRAGVRLPLRCGDPVGLTGRSLVLRHARSGDIVVLHDGGARGERTVKTLRAILPELRRRGYRVVSLNELVAAV